MTEPGRALNRRVEFLISPAMSANLAAVQQYVVPESYFYTNQPDAVRPRQAAQVTARLPTIANVYQFKPQTSPQQMANPNDDLLRPLGGLPLSPVSKQPASSASAPIQRVTLAPTMPVAPVQMVPISPVEQREVDPVGSGPASY